MIKGAPKLDQAPTMYEDLTERRAAFDFITNIGEETLTRPELTVEDICEPQPHMREGEYYIVFTGVNTSQNYFPVLNRKNDALLKIVRAYFTRRGHGNR